MTHTGATRRCLQAKCLVSKMETGPGDLNPKAYTPFIEIQAVLEYGPAAIAAEHLFRGPKVPLCHGYTAMAPVQNSYGQYTILLHFVTENLLTV